MNPDLIRAAIAEGVRHHQTGRLHEARQHYERVLAADPRQPDALNLLGMIDHAEGNIALAVSRIRQAIALNPQMPGFHTNLGTVLHASGDSRAAANAFRQALVVKPDHLAALFNLGVVLQALSEFDEAAKTYAAALKINPRLHDVWNNLGICQAKLGQTAAIDSFDRAIQLNPQFLGARVNAANLLFTTGRFDDAEQMYRKLLQQHSGQAEAQNNLGLILIKLNRVPEAADAFRAALRARPDYTGAALNLGNALFELGDHHGAISQYRALIARSPDDAAARLALAVAAIPMMALSSAQSEQVPQDFTQAVADLEGWSSSHPGALAKAIGTVQPFLLAYRPTDVTAPLARFGQLVCREAALARSMAERASSVVTGGARLRLGIVSGQVRTHPVWQIILRGILEGLDRDRFDVTLYDTGHFPDAETDWAKANVAQYQRQPLTTEGWADHISREAPDVLFYPEVGMDAVAGALAPLRLAKLQVASWGHPVSTGLPSIDLYLSGEAIEPANADAHYTERLIKLPGTGVLTRFGVPRSRRWSGPQRQTGHVRFALCQQPMKFDPADDAMIARIANEVGPSEFWIVQSRKHPWASDLLVKRLTGAFAAVGLDPARYLQTTPWMDTAAFLGFLDEMDVMLDCPAFSGYTTAWQAIHRGLPIVTLEGRFMRQRLAAGVLRQIGCVEGIADTADQYVARAVDYADRSRSEPARLECRRRIAAAAGRADGNTAAIDAMQQLFLSA